MIDHRKLGRELDLFDSDPMIGAGLPYWLPGGAAARHEVEEYLRELERRAGYQHVYSPVIGKLEMYERSGHWDHFRDDMFPPMALSADDEFVMRPSMCPHHALMFRARGRSYRDLPMRIAELGGQYRAERSGVLGGLSRVRSIWLNDAHIFCPLDQVGAEISAILSLIDVAHRDIGIRRGGMRLSLRGPGGSWAGTEAMWEQASDLLRSALIASGSPFSEAPGDAAFYGPKIDIQIIDPQGRESTISTIQVDFHMPSQFGLSYVDSSGGRSVPVMIHRSLAGSMERLFAYLIEASGGAFPVWYAPVQVIALPVGADQEGAAEKFARSCIEAGLRAEVAAAGSVGSRIRLAAKRKIPYVAVIGLRESNSGEVALRLRDGSQLDPVLSANAIELISKVVASRSHALLP